jgi:hypothetical protein
MVGNSGVCLAGIMTAHESPHTPGATDDLSVSARLCVRVIHVQDSSYLSTLPFVPSTSELIHVCVGVNTRAGLHVP